MERRFILPQPVWPLSDRGIGPRLIDLAMLPFISGELPFARQAFFADLDDLEALVPPDATVEWELSQDSGDHHRLVSGAGWRAHLLLVRRRPEVQVLITAESATLADEVLSRMRGTAPEPELTAGQSRLTMWSAGTGGAPSRYRRLIDAPAWSDIARNYPPEVREALARVVGLAEPPAHGGRLLLWYGEPGTGKTTAIRSLARQWATWADLHFVVDPEEFFAGPDYLMHVVTTEEPWWERADSGTGRWKVVVVEDADELVRADARRASGASLSRLLNLTDGILGHGMRVLLLLTTNEPLHGLHPAVVRPGRCLADVQFARFNQHQAAEWLEGRADPPAGETSLAELYRLRGDVETIASHAPSPERSAYL